ncbi:MAG: hypothetical protein H7338_03440, partial [Candidatus Sericytochromatia bacterium]|nr:hypothetical protein [Candidatus Sericytochromatia bacterium]
MFDAARPVGQQPTTYTNSQRTGAAQQNQTTTQQPGMPTDQYGGYGQGAAAPGVPLNVIANDYRRPVDYVGLRVLSKLSSQGINTTEDLIRRCATPTKRDWLARTVAAFDSQMTTAQA